MPRKPKSMTTTRPKPRVYVPIPDDVFERVLERISAGEGTLRALKEEGITNYGRFYARLNANENDWHSYARAKNCALDRLAAEILEIQDEPARLVAQGGESPGDPRTDAGWVQHQRNRVEARKWLLSKLAPKKYGDRLDATLAGPYGGPVQTEMRVVEGLDVFRERLMKVIANRKGPPDRTEQEDELPLIEPPSCRDAVRKNRTR